MTHSCEHTCTQYTHTHVKYAHNSTTVAVIVAALPTIVAVSNSNQQYCWLRQRRQRDVGVCDDDGNDGNTILVGEGQF